jgi:2-oxoglutarate ferredoxin oxidoreductase subunit delta
MPAQRATAALSQQKKMPRLNKRFKVKIDGKLCKGCYLCIRFCPMGVFVRSDIIGELGYDLAKVEFPEKCTGCKACLLYCPDFAIALEEDKESNKRN